MEDGLQFVDLQEGFPDEYFTLASALRLFVEISALQPKFQEFVGNLHTRFPITCIISDLNFLEPHKTAIHFGLPSVGFCTQCSFALSAKCFGQRLVEEGLLPLPQAPVDRDASDGDVSVDSVAAVLAREVTCIPGIHPMRLGEYHTGLLVTDISGPVFQYFTVEQMKLLHSLDWILVNTFEDLEKFVMEEFERHLGIKLTAVGPLTLDSTSADGNVDSNSSRISSFWPEEEKCLKWLDKQDPLSVVYSSLGSLTHLTDSELEEFALGLEDSQVPFLLVARPNLVDDSSKSGEPQFLPSGFVERTKERAMIVSWAPQLKVLGHPAIAGFVTHCGWNSVLESVSMGVPVLTYPQSLDQLMINRYVVSVWKMGLEFDRVDRESLGRHEVALKVRALAAKDSEVRAAARMWKEVAKKAVERGGSSYNNMATFVSAMCKKAQLQSQPFCQSKFPSEH